MNVHILNTQNTLFKKEKDWLTDYMHQKMLWDCLIVLFKKKFSSDGKNSQNNKKIWVHDNNFPPENDLPADS